MKKKITISGIVAFAPLLAFAQTLGSIADIFGNLVAVITPIIVALALLFFFWGLAKYILNAGDETAKAEGRNIMIWGIIALFVMVSVWGLVQVLNNTFGVSQTATVTPPSVQLR